MFYLGLLVLPCTHTKGPCSPRPVGLFTLNHRVFRPCVGDRCPLSWTVVPHPGPSSLIPDCRPSSRTVVPRPGPSSLVPDRRPSSRTVVPRPGPSSLVPDRRPSPGPSSLGPDRRPSARTVVPRPGPSSLGPDRRPSARTVVPRPGPSSLVPDLRPSSLYLTNESNFLPTEQTPQLTSPKMPSNLSNCACSRTTAHHLTTTPVFYPVPEALNGTTGYGGPKVQSLGWVCEFLILFLYTCTFYQLLRVQHSCSSTQSWGSVLPSI